MHWLLLPLVILAIAFYELTIPIKREKFTGNFGDQGTGLKLKDWDAMTKQEKEAE